MESKSIKINFIIFIVLIITFIFSVSVGFAKTNISEVFNILIGNGTDKQNLIFFSFRIPRNLISVLIGACLGISGVIFQGIYKNELADSNILGINSGIALTVVTFLIINGSVNNSLILILTLGFIGGLVPSILIYLLAYKKNQGVSNVRLILNGIGMNLLFTALLLFITIKLDPNKFQFSNNWINGSIMYSSWKYIIFISLVLILVTPLAIYKSRILDLLILDEEVTKELGVNITKERIILLIIALCIATSGISLGGGIGFVGLISSHISRMLVGYKSRNVIITSGFVGGLLVLMADTIARVIIQPAEFPTGIIIAVIGTPYFIFLLIKLKK